MHRAIPAVLWTAFIFIASSDAFSAPHTGSILQSIALAVANVKMAVFGAWDKGPLPGLL